ncbi:hypothetical protein BN2475_1200005 [Paraburkholderia ribeironis]|uniref:Uncharacterized protein n=1 Tax=Paraburkholderia ribeironis TaxID=1247936 RepID=A0A1N7SNE9_9BURK|nr:hypothetical protein BN2475_1200005 [Paraburkholderia ribeironis]
MRCSLKAAQKTGALKSLSHGSDGFPRAVQNNVPRPESPRARSDVGTPLAVFRSPANNPSKHTVPTTSRRFHVNPAIHRWEAPCFDTLQSFLLSRSSPLCSALVASPQVRRKSPKCCSSSSR